MEQNIYCGAKGDLGSSLCSNTVASSELFIFFRASVSLSVCVLNCVQLFETPWTVAWQAPLSMEFSRQEYCNGLPFPTLGDLPDSGKILHLL